MTFSSGSGHAALFLQHPSFSPSCLRGLFNDPQPSSEFKSLNDLINKCRIVAGPLRGGGMLVDRLLVGGRSLQLDVAADDGFENHSRKHLLKFALGLSRDMGPGVEIGEQHAKKLELWIRLPGRVN